MMAIRGFAKANASGGLRNRKVMAAVAAGTLAVLALSYLVLIGPQRSRAAELDTEIATTEQQIAAARVASLQPSAPTRVDQLFRLTKAVPDHSDMPGMLLELSRLAAETGIDFDSITPTAPAAAGTLQSVPIQLAFRGNYYELSDFLFRLRTLVAKNDDRLDVSGRLYAVDGVDFSQGAPGEQLSARVTAKAFVYGSGTTGSVAPPPTTPPATTPATSTPPAAGTGSAG